MFKIKSIIVLVYLLSCDVWVNGLVSHSKISSCIFRQSLQLFMLSSPTSDESLIVLTDASINRKIPPLDVIQAITAVENSNLKVNCEVDQINGTWELIFSSLIKGGYFPVSEICDFRTYRLTSSWGPFPLGEITGPSTVLSKTPPIIEFSASKISFGPISIPLGRKEPRTYNFLHIGNDIAVAKSMPSGGLTLLKRVTK